MRTLVPSRNLLRFLKSQTESAFVGSGTALGARGSRLCSRTRPLNPPAKRTSRYHSTVCQRQLTAAPHASPLQQTPQLPVHHTRSAGAKQPKSFFSTSRAPRRKVSEPDAAAKARATTWQERLWGSSAKKGDTPLRPDDLPSRRDDSGPGSPLFASRRALAALEPRLRCTEVDEYGKAILVDGEFKKTELIAKYGLLPRDLRKIDSSTLPHILVRPSAILLNLLHLKVLIKHDRVLLFDVYGSKTSYPQSAFMYDLQGKLQQSPQPGSGGLPYEFRALEAVLTSVTSELEADFEAVREPVVQVLSELEDDIDRYKLRALLILSKRVSTFEQKAKLVRDAIEELLEADDDLAAMYLTEKTHDLMRGLDDHTEVEMLLESYHKLTDEIVQEAGNLVSDIRNTEDM
jgi:magnesium transporter